MVGTDPGGALAPISDDDWPEAVAELRDGFAGKLNVYRVMAHHPALLRAWAALRDHVVVQTSLGAQRSEVVILRSGVRLGSAYEWGHHVSRARACGLEDARIASLAGEVEDMAPEDGLLARAVDELFADARLTPETAGALRGLVGEQGMLDLMATVGFYSTLGFILNSFGTPLDEAVARELAEHPLSVD